MHLSHNRSDPFWFLHRRIWQAVCQSTNLILHYDCLPHKLAIWYWEYRYVTSDHNCDLVHHNLSIPSHSSLSSAFERNVGIWVFWHIGQCCDSYKYNMYILELQVLARVRQHESRQGRVKGCLMMIQWVPEGLEMLLCCSWWNLTGW